MFLKKSITKYQENINKNRFKDKFHLILYCRVLIYLEKEIDEESIDRLIEYIDNETNYLTISDTLGFFFYAQKYDFIFELGVKYQDKFEQIVLDILSLSLQDEKLNLNILKKFISKLKPLSRSENILLSEVYQKYGDFSNVLKLLKTEWEKEQDIKIGVNILINLLNTFFTKGDIDKNEIERFIQYLISNSNLYEKLELPIYVSQYYFREKQFQRAFEIFNYAVLQTNIDNLTQNEKDMIAHTFGFPIEVDENYNYKSDINNQILQKDNVQYIIDKYEVSQNFKTLFNFETLSEDEFYLLKSDLDESNIKCISSFLSEYFLYNFSTKVQRFTIDKSFEENPLKFFEDKLTPYKKAEAESYEAYNNIEFISLYELFSNYEEYPKKIEKLLEDEKIIFFSGYNYLIEAPKILTFSSIIFLKHIDRLDLILNYENIYIQRSVLNWIFTKLKENTKENIYWKELYQLLNKKKDKIVDDTDIAFPFPNSEKLDVIEFQQFFGILDFKAIILSLQKNFQLISEDYSHLQFIGDVLGNENIPTNSSYLITNELAKQNNIDENSSLIEKLHKRNYKYILPFYSGFIESIEKIDILINNEVPIIEKIPKQHLLMHKITKEYGWLDDYVKFKRESILRKKQ